MKKSLFYCLMIVAIMIALVSCKKETKEEAYANTHGGSTNVVVPPEGYVWTGDKSKITEIISYSITYLGTGLDSAHPTYPSYRYTFIISMDNALCDPTEAELVVPHVGPGGVTIVNNVHNDATYGISAEKLGNKLTGRVILTVATSIPTGTGYCDLVFAPGCARSYNVPCYFVTYGQYRNTADHYIKYLKDDHPPDNMYGIRFYPAHIEPIKP